MLLSMFSLLRTFFLPTSTSYCFTWTPALTRPFHDSRCKLFWFRLFAALTKCPDGESPACRRSFHPRSFAELTARRNRLLFWSLPGLVGEEPTSPVAKFVKFCMLPTVWSWSADATFYKTGCTGCRGSIMLWPGCATSPWLLVRFSFDCDYITKLGLPLSCFFIFVLSSLLTLPENSPSSSSTISSGGAIINDRCEAAETPLKRRFYPCKLACYYNYEPWRINLRGENSLDALL